MAIEYTNPLSNLSYTNKDFQTIYPELLDLVRKISYKWVPDESDESDPGVILLKLCALIADKNNYNIDKNVLECFPLSVTQESNARQLFEQLGYSMKWYQAATGTASFSWIGDYVDGKTNYVIPQFSMISNADSTIVYTLTEPVALADNSDTAFGSIMQGIVTDYTVNGYSNITYADIDSKNRLYFQEYNVAENGIFIYNTNTSQPNIISEQWVPKDNLSVEDLGTKCYKFGIDKDSSRCYIEFPDDIEDLIGEGLTIKYIITDGANGNVVARELEKFYVDVTIADPTKESANDKLILSAQTNVKIGNWDAILNGKDPESIDEAYKNYKKTIGVFNTLVAVKDYENYINRTGLVSNCFVCDRTNDVQSSYYIVSNDNDALTRKILQIEPAEYVIKGSGGESNKIYPYNTLNVLRKYEDIAELQKTMDSDISEDINHYQESIDTSVTLQGSINAFNLKLYALKFVNIPQINKSSYNATFEIVKNAEDGDTDPEIDALLDAKFGKLSEIKCIQHDFIPHRSERICMLKNKYPLNIKIMPQYSLTTLQQEELTQNIQHALWETLNSQ